MNLQLPEAFCTTIRAIVTEQVVEPNGGAVRLTLETRAPDGFPAAPTMTHTIRCAEEALGEEPISKIIQESIEDDHAELIAVAMWMRAHDPVAFESIVDKLHVSADAG